MKAVNIVLPRRDHEWLKEIYEEYRIPYSDVFRQAIFHFKRYVLRQYLGDLKRSRHEDIQDNERISISEQMDEILQRAFRDSTFQGPKMAFYTGTSEDRVRICLRMTTWDHQFLLNISNPRRSTGECQDDPHPFWYTKSWIDRGGCPRIDLHHQLVPASGVSTFPGHSIYIIQCCGGLHPALETWIPFI